MTKAQLIKTNITWSETKKYLLTQDPNLDKADLEAERQMILRLAGAKQSGDRYSMKTLTNTGVSTFLDLCETTITGKPNQKRRSASIIYRLDELNIPGIDNKEAYLTKLSLNKFNQPKWRENDAHKLRLLLITATNRSAARAAKS